MIYLFCHIFAFRKVIDNIGLVCKCFWAQVVIGKNSISFFLLLIIQHLCVDENETSLKIIKPYDAVI